MNDNNFYSEYHDNNSKSYVNDMSITETSTALTKAYFWMFIGALLTFLSGILFSNLFARLILNNNAVGLSFFMVCFVVSFIVEMILCFTINKNALVKADSKKALTGYLVYSLLNGFTFSSFFIYFDASVLVQVFGVVAIYYLVLTLISVAFKNKIHKIAAFAWIGLITLVIASAIVSIYSLIAYSVTGSVSMPLYLGISIFGLIVFSILTIVDIKSMTNLIANSYNKKAASIAAAFSLYLDFINIFIYVLRILLILGKNSSRKN